MRVWRKKDRPGEASNDQCYTTIFNVLHRLSSISKIFQNTFIKLKEADVSF